MMPPMQRLAWTGLLVLGIAAAAVPWALALAGGRPPVSIALLLLPLPFIAVGASVFARRPDSLVVRRLMALCALVPMAGASTVVLERAAVSGDAGFLWAAALANHAGVIGFLVVVVGLLAVFPDGTYSHPFERVLVRVAASAILLLPAAVLVMDPLPGPKAQFHIPPIPNPLAIPDLALFAPVVGGTLEALFALFLPSIALVLARYRRSDAERRRQMRWPLLAVLLATAMLLVDTLVTAAGWGGRDVLDLGWTVVMFWLPVSFAIAIFRPRILDVDVVIRRSIVYGALWLLIALGYVGVGGAAGIAAGSRLPVEVAVLLTIIATLLFQPIRSRLEALADRWVFGERVSGSEVLIRLGESLRETVGVEELLPNLAATIRAGLGLRWVRVRLILASDGEGVSEPAATAGEPASLPAAVIPIVYGGTRLGEIECGARTEGDGSLSPADLQLVEGVARHGALAIRNARLTAELRARVEEVRDQARQLDESRTRLVQAQVAERRRIERDIHDGVQQGIVSLIARAGLARAQLGANPAAEATLVALQADAERVLGDLRETIAGIHPAVLTDRGLVDAIEERAERLPLPVAIDADPAVRGNRYADEIESAAFFVISEGVANALKHASPRRLDIRLEERDGWLSVEVRDDGSGFDTSKAVGSGLRGVADRVEAVKGRFWVETSVGRGTVVSALLPAGAALRAEAALPAGASPHG
jgi:signal transduction histidine kinase